MNSETISFVHTPMETTKKAEFEFEDIKMIYRGKSHTCYCGCAGTYAYTGFAEREAWQGEPNPKLAKRRLKEFLSWEGEVESIGDYIFTKRKKLNSGEEIDLTIYLTQKS